MRKFRIALAAAAGIAASLPRPPPRRRSRRSRVTARLATVCPATKPADYGRVSASAPRSALPPIAPVCGKPGHELQHHRYPVGHPRVRDIHPQPRWALPAGQCHPRLAGHQAAGVLGVRRLRRRPVWRPGPMHIRIRVESVLGPVWIARGETPVSARTFSVALLAQARTVRRADRKRLADVNRGLRP